MTLPGEIREALHCFPRRRVWRGFRRGRGPRPAAVAITVVLEGNNPAVLITRRAESLRTHPGQYALPGGRTDPGESAPAAARRELTEELGIALPPESVLGLLDDYLTRSGFMITPVVLWAGELDQPLSPHQAEVAAAFAVPFTDLDVDPVFVAIPESDRPVIRLPLRGGWLHAPTAAVLHQFREVVLHRRRTRVAHLEQPVFAWR
ncbi:MAG TPA: CoA pyrophosphatase [Pseudonocardiaceae bacterium]|jgi:8-oxo-dGTP pyrophosphatase MutT (NUDIX family)|nr:CoA pyrophosphatase [Pseudonocardiaceae bacterium]